MKITKFIARQKFRFDLGSSFMTVINFAFIVIAASDKLATVIHISTALMVIILVPAAVVSVWLFGFILDKIKFFHAYQGEQNQRNDVLSEIHSKIK